MTCSLKYVHAFGRYEGLNRLTEGETDSCTDVHNHAQITSLLYASGGLAGVGIIQIFYSIVADYVRA